MIFNKKQMAELLQVSVPTINRLVEKGMPHLKIGKSVRFDTDTALTWIKESYYKSRK